MRLLLDTHVFLCWIDDAPALSPKARAAIANPANECLLSLACCWEMAIKIGLGKLRLPGTLERFIPEQLAARLSLAPDRISSCGKSWRHSRWRQPRLPCRFASSCRFVCDPALVCHRFAIISISTSAPRASPLTPMHVRAGRRSAGKYVAYTAFIRA